MCRQRATYRCKALNKGYNFALNLIVIGGMHMKLCAPKVAESQLWEFRDSHSGVPGQNGHLDVAPVERCKVYYKGKGGGFPQVRAVVSLVNSNCPWLVLAPKMLQLCTNHFVLVLCKFAWVIEACNFFLVPFQSSNMPLYPSKVLRARERAPTPYSSIVFSLDSHLSPSRSWEHVRCNVNICITFCNLPCFLGLENH